jgi:hypothetical protein
MTIENKITVSETAQTNSIHTTSEELIVFDIAEYGQVCCLDRLTGERKNIYSRDRENYELSEERAHEDEILCLQAINSTKDEIKKLEKSIEYQKNIQCDIKGNFNFYKLERLYKKPIKSAIIASTNLGVSEWEDIILEFSPLSKCYLNEMLLAVKNSKNLFIMDLVESINKNNYSFCDKELRLGSATIRKASMENHGSYIKHLCADMKNCSPLRYLYEEKIIKGELLEVEKVEA